MALATDDPWQAIASAALLGTERQPFQLPNISGNLGNCLSQLSARPKESALLSAAGIVSLHQRVGWLPEVRSVIEVEPCSPDDLPRCSPRAARCLQQILEGQFPQLLSEWLEKAAIARQRVPEMLLPSLLDKGRQQRELRAAILPVLGQRGRWLAARNPDWNYAVALTTEADWETGTPLARLLYLQDLRSHNPDQAREATTKSKTQHSDSQPPTPNPQTPIPPSSANTPNSNLLTNSKNWQKPIHANAHQTGSFPLGQYQSTYWEAN
ncbi:hypothetical protein IFO70_25995 [Phormidium tenue FACHB-886]|nr:hypothetical protein [Phormidium tenue FACHB-886]